MISEVLLPAPPTPPHPPPTDGFRKFRGSPSHLSPACQRRRRRGMADRQRQGPPARRLRNAGSTHAIVWVNRLKRMAQDRRLAGAQGCGSRVGGGAQVAAAPSLRTVLIQAVPADPRVYHTPHIKGAANPTAKVTCLKTRGKYSTIFEDDLTLNFLYYYLYFRFIPIWF